MENLKTNLGNSLPAQWLVNSSGYREPEREMAERTCQASPSRSVKVVWLCANFDGTPGGTGTHLMQWAKNLNQSKLNVILVHGAGDEEGRIASLFGSNSHLRVLAIPELRRPDQLFLSGLLKLYQVFKRERPDIVHTVLIQSDLLGTLAARLARVPVVVSSVEGQLFSPRATTRPKALFYRLGYSLIRNRIDRVIAISHSVSRNLIEHFGVDPAKIQVIYPGVAENDFSANVNINSRHCFGHSRSPSVGVVSRLVEGKGVECFLMAVPEILKFQPRARISIVGDGPLKEYLVGLARALGVVRSVEFCGWISPVREVMRGFDVVVMPSFEEGLPWVVLEALALGKPVVATNVGGVPEIITHNLHGYLVEPGDSLALAHGVIGLLEDPRKASALAQAGRARVAKEFTASREAAEFHALYRSMLETKHLSLICG